MLDVEALAEHRRHLADEVVKLKLFSDISRSPEGKFIIDWIDGRKRNLQAFYSSLPAHDPHATLALSAIQAAEGELNALRNRITDAEEYKKVLEDQLAHVVRLLEIKRNPAKGTANKLVSTAIRREDAQD